QVPGARIVIAHLEHDLFRARLGSRPRTGRAAGAERPRQDRRAKREHQSALHALSPRSGAAIRRTACVPVGVTRQPGGLFHRAARWRRSAVSGILRGCETPTGIMDLRNLLFGTDPVRQHLESWRPALYRVAYSWCHDRALADDLVQDTMVKAMSRRAQLRDIERL